MPCFLFTLTCAVCGFLWAWNRQLEKKIENLELYKEHHTREIDELKRRKADRP